MVRFQAISFCTTSNVPTELKGLWSTGRTTPWIRVNGRTADGTAVMMYTAGFSPYAWVELVGDEKINLGSFSRWIANKISSPVRSITMHDNKCSLAGNEPVRVARVELELPVKVPRLLSLANEPDCPSYVGPRVFEANVPYHMRFCIDNGAAPFCWVDVDDDDMRVSHQVSPKRCHLTFAAMAENVRFDTQDTSNAPMPLITFDCEMETKGDDDHFPKAELGDEVIQIGGLVYANATADATEANLVQRVIFTRGGDVAPFPAAQRIAIKRCADERSLLLKFRAWVNHVQPDFDTGYNQDKFDWPFLMGRADMLGIGKEFRDIGKVPGELMESKQSHFHSDSRGYEDDENVVIAGITNVDMLRIIRNSEKLRSYKLDAVVKETFGEQEGKTGVTYKEIPVLFNGSPEDRRKLCEYCIWDAELAAMLLFKKKVIVNHVEMSRVTGVDIHALITGGQQIKVYNQILRECRPENLIVPTRARVKESNAGAVDGDDDNALVRPTTVEEFLAGAKRGFAGKKKGAKKRKPEYEGATVIDPHKGFYSTPITTLDFSSLYPSIMRGHNLCYRSLVRKGSTCIHGHDAFASKEVLDCCVSETPINARFWRATQVEGILPRILTKLLDARKHAKAEMAVERDLFKKAVLDGRQLALKTSANSVYGFTGAVIGILPCIEISASVTSYGRDMIHYIQGLVERKYRGAGLVGGQVAAINLETQVVYGDSVVGDTPLLLCSPDDEQCWVLASELATITKSSFARRNGDRKDEFQPATGWRVWSSDGWTQIVRAIRHRAPGKRLVTITTQSGQVTVTCDHSLLRPDGTKVRPIDVCVGEQLMHRDLPPYKGLLARSPSDHPAFVISRGIGYGSQGLAYAKMLEVELTEAKLPFATPLVRARAAHIRNTVGLCSRGDVITWIEDAGMLDSTDYVYDLETETHHFAAGVGRMIVHNTDSVMVDFGVTEVADAMAVGMNAAELINAAFRLKIMLPAERDAFLAEHAPTYMDAETALLDDTDRLVPIINWLYTSAISIIFEIVLFQYLLISKKRYAGGFYTKNPDVPDKVHKSGIESVRRDNAYFTAQTVGNVVDLLMESKDPLRALALARHAVRTLCTGRVPLDELIISKGFSKPESEYVNPGAQAHLKVHRLREQREPGSGYRLGERIPYVVVCGTEKNGKVKRLVDNVEDPDWVKKHKTPISINYYLNNQITKPLARIVDTIWGEGAAASLLFTQDMTAQNQASPAALFGGVVSTAPRAPLPIEPTDKMQTLVTKWKRRPKQPSLFQLLPAK